MPDGAPMMWQVAAQPDGQVRLLAFEQDRIVAFEYNWAGATDMAAALMFQAQIALGQTTPDPGACVNQIWDRFRLRTDTEFARWLAKSLGRA